MSTSVLISVLGGTLLQEVSIRGLLTAVDWSTEGEVRRVALLTSDESQYDIDVDEWNIDLLAYLRQEVMVTGIVVEGERGKKNLILKSFVVGT